MILAGRTIITIFDPRWSWSMTVLLLVSITALTIAIERMVYFFKRKVNAQKFLDKVRETFRAGGVTEVLAYVKGKDNPHAYVTQTVFENYDQPLETIAELIESSVLEQRLRFEKFLAGLNTIGYVSPLLGLLGTVVGLIRAFMNIAVTGSGGPAVVSGGIAEALLATAFGLIIAVPSIWLYNYLAKRAADMCDELESLGRKLLQIVELSKEGKYGAAEARKDS